MDKDVSTGATLLEDERTSHSDADTRPRNSPQVRALANPVRAGEVPAFVTRPAVKTAGVERERHAVLPRPPVVPDRRPKPGPIPSDQSQEANTVAPAATRRERCAVSHTEGPPSEHCAWLLEEAFGALFLRGSMGPASHGFDVKAFKLYRDNLLERAGSPSDPIEIMLIEQVALAHLSIGRLHSEAAGSSNLEQTKVFATLANTSSGEFRRSVLALKAYRAPDGTSRSGDKN